MSITVTPPNNYNWDLGPTNNVNYFISQESLLDSNIELDLSSFLNVTDYYEIIIPTTVDTFTVLGNLPLKFKASVKATTPRTIALTINVNNLGFFIDDTVITPVPIFDISVNNLDNIFTFEGTNIIENLSESKITNNAGIFVGEGTKLTIYGIYSTSSNNILTVSGGVYSAGIGSGTPGGAPPYINAGTIIITDDPNNITGSYNTNIIASSISLGAAIGGGIGGSGGDITIGGHSMVTANGDYYGCGIGGGFDYDAAGNSGTITFQDDCKIYANGGTGGCGIGGGACFYGIGGNIDSLIIKDNSYVECHGGYVGAGIGGGFGLAISGGTITLLQILDNATVYSTGGDLGVGIGGGYGIFGGDGGVIEIGDSASDSPFVEARGGQTAGGISGGTSGGLNLTGLVGPKGGVGPDLSIFGNSIVNAYAGIDGSGIGGGAGDIGGDGGILSLYHKCKVTASNFTGYYPSSEYLAILNMCGGNLFTPDLNISELNFNPNPDCSAGAIVIEDPDYIPPPEIQDSYLIVQLIYPDGTPYTSPIYLNNILGVPSPLLVNPDSGGYLRFFLAPGTYFFSTPPIPIVYYTTTFEAPHIPYTDVIVLVVPIRHITRGINIFKAIK